MNERGIGGMTLTDVNRSTVI